MNPFASSPKEPNCAYRPSHPPETNSTCTFGDGAHHFFYYSNGEFRGAD
jgi:hypothetical protein